MWHAQSTPSRFPLIGNGGEEVDRRSGRSLGGRSRRVKSTTNIHIVRSLGDLILLQQDPIARTFGLDACRCVQDYGSFHGLRVYKGPCCQIWSILQFTLPKFRRGGRNLQTVPGELSRLYSAKLAFTTATTVLGVFADKTVQLNSSEWSFIQPG